tara:strand:+ start:322 stop:609 length:288 start_codon:yes stop_codon:yes gene_type:complete
MALRRTPAFICALSHAAQDPQSIKLTQALGAFIKVAEAEFGKGKLAKLVAAVRCPLPAATKAHLASRAARDGGLPGTNFEPNAGFGLTMPSEVRH